MYFFLYFRFRIDNTDHIIDVNKGNLPFEYDQVNIICPVYSGDTKDDDAEKYIIYNVSSYLYIIIYYCFYIFKYYLIVSMNTMKNRHFVKVYVNSNYFDNILKVLLI